ncbi:class I glutamine amidotransferase-like protein, partial [Suillus subalutaceus]|uniref:class I glutamine amidotransferase-like protein n=1 Tax=Suillus subalutaceus TaxID=48586 RepID=UPI001B86AB73
LGIILSGYPYSAHDDDAPHVYPGIYALGVPILGMRYAFQEICWNHKGRVAKCDHREYGLAEVQISRSSESVSSVDALFEGLGDQMQVWMSHGDQLSVMPPDFHVIGRTNAAPYAAIAHNSKSLHGIQFHPEVTHSPPGKQFIDRSVLNICQCRPNWTMVK